MWNWKKNIHATKQIQMYPLVFVRAKTCIIVKSGSLPDQGTVVPISITTFKKQTIFVALDKYVE